MSVPGSLGLDAIVDFLSRANSAYIVISPTATTSPNFPLRGYAGASGRLDVVARSMTAPLHFEATAVSIGILLGPPNPPVTVAGYRECLGPGERSAVEAIRRALHGRPPRGCIALRAGHDFILHALERAGFELVYLSEKGEDISRSPGVARCRCAYLAGAHVDVPPSIEADIIRSAKAVVSIGPRSLLTSHVFAFLAWFRSVTAGSGRFYAADPGNTRDGGV